MIGLGFTTAERPRVGALYWAAFRRKLRAGFPDDASGQAFVTGVLRADRMLVARVGGEVAGVCGFHEGGHGAVAFSWRELRERFGVRTSLRVSAALAPLGRSEAGGVLVLDGVCVDARHRGRGIGSALLAAAQAHAATRGDREVQLSVVDTNPRAEALYRRLGYRVVGEGSMGVLGELYGFRRYRTMRRPVAS
ncbi:GNAT family N-acetyltransferase [Actinoplanes sp. NPDC023714]|uniref:GNAT family N-acetyltransferase n=1 Tax=Actinoplanes sp. NPDC023714 TaxID=3154322 RepID=UPI0034064982